MDGNNTTGSSVLKEVGTVDNASDILMEAGNDMTSSTLFNISGKFKFRFK
jgi:hypothetical protein